MQLAGCAMALERAWMENRAVVPVVERAESRGHAVPAEERARKRSPVLRAMAQERASQDDVPTSRMHATTYSRA